VNVLFRQNDFHVINFDMSKADFFQEISEDRFLAAYRAPPPRQSYLLSGHFRLDQAIFSRMTVPHLIITTLRDPIERMLSNYNFTLRVPGNPWHDDVVKGMPFVEYTRNLHAAIGPQYSFFDDTGLGTFARTGTATVQQCLDNLLERVSIFGLTERFSEFAVLVGYLLGRPRLLAVPQSNVTRHVRFPSKLPPKEALTIAERDEVTSLLADDIWFYQEAVKEYEQRIADPRLRTVFSKVLPLVKVCDDALNQILTMDDPGDPKRRAFDRIV
jgi:hypothetical protein